MDLICLSELRSNKQSLSAIEFELVEVEESSAVHCTSAVEKKDKEKAFIFQVYKAEWTHCTEIPQEKQSSHKYKPGLLNLCLFKRIISVHLSLSLSSSPLFPSAFSSHSIESHPIDTVISLAEKHLARQLVRKCAWDMWVCLKARWGQMMRSGCFVFLHQVKTQTTVNTLNMHPWAKK